jgi:hypothetical protein
MVYHPIHTWANCITDFDITSDDDESVTAIEADGDDNSTTTEANTDVNV